MSQVRNKEKTLIGVLASHDSKERNETLADVFREAYQNRDLLRKFGFIFTGGTYERLILGHQTHGATTTQVRHRLGYDIANFLHNECGIIRLPPTEEGGVTMLSCLITQRKVSIVWAFLSPLTAHLLFPENLALLRLSDQWRVKKLMNKASVTEWLKAEAERDENFNLQPVPFTVTFEGSGLIVTCGEADQKWNKPSVSHDHYDVPDLIEARDEKRLDEELKKTVIALISHDEMKNRMLDFVIDYEHELAKFKSIVATGTTGKLIQDASPKLADKVRRYHSGPKGGDIEIATEILCGGCHVVIFFVDPLHPHPHIEDIRGVFGACMINDDVRLLSNEIQARAWMDRMIRGT
ncbi:MAG: methylglyoxal synthase [Candidatus Zixiibacteriota bacterium]